MTLSTDHDNQVCAYSKETATLDRCFELAVNGKAVHFAFNSDGSEVWLSDWAPDGSVVILDGTTLAEIARVSGLVTPRGQFNVYHTANDIYQPKCCPETRRVSRPTATANGKITIIPAAKIGLRIFMVRRLFFTAVDYAGLERFKLV